MIMGYGRWTKDDFKSYSASMGRSVDKDGKLSGSYGNRDVFKSTALDPLLDPFNVTRECCDSADHPSTFPVILALDVTGSMGQAAVEVAKQLNVIMTDLYDQNPDVQFMIMGIGDFAYDKCPLQVSQFEADIRIAEQLDKLYFEFGGGGNYFESYTAAWYFALHHTRLDAWKRGKKGIIITMGDERLNPYIPARGGSVSLTGVTGDNVQGDIETDDLFADVAEKYHIYHLNVDHRKGFDGDGIRRSWLSILDEEHFRTVTVNGIAQAIVEIVKSEYEGKMGHAPQKDSFLQKIASGISW